MNAPTRNPTLSPRTAAAAARRSIMLRLTVPRFGGVTKLLVKSLLGLDDIAALFARGRVEGSGDADELHESFDVELELNTGVGGETKLGLIELMNDGGQLRLTLPGGWGSFLTARADRTDTIALNGKRLARGWFTPAPGSGVEVPIPGLNPPRKLGIAIAA
jgi:hypothetical protein